MAKSNVLKVGSLVKIMPGVGPEMTVVSLGNKGEENYLVTWWCNERREIRKDWVHKSALELVK